MTPLRVIVGASFPRDGPSELHDLAKALRAGDGRAVGRVLPILGRGLEEQAPSTAATADVTLVPMAGHRAGTVSGAALLLADQLAAAHPRWTVARALERIHDMPAARALGSRDPATEAGSLRWATVTGAGPVLLIDDVVHTGASLDSAWLAAPAELRERLVALVAFRAVD